MNRKPLNECSDICQFQACSSGKVMFESWPICAKKYAAIKNHNGYRAGEMAHWIKCFWHYPASQQRQNFNFCLSFPVVMVKYSDQSNLREQVFISFEVAGSVPHAGEVTLHLQLRNRETLLATALLLQNPGS